MIPLLDVLSDSRLSLVWREASADWPSPISTCLEGGYLGKPH